MTTSSVCTTTEYFSRSCSTGKERDAESGNDYFDARYYSSSMGRWMSPDWSAKVEPVPYAKLGDPQSLNLYAYMSNNPLGGVDAYGHWGCQGSQEGFCSPAAQDGMRNGMSAGEAYAAGQAQQQNGDPTLPTSVKDSTDNLSPLDKALGPTPQNMFMVATGDLGEVGEAGTKLLSTIGEDTKLVKYAEDAGKSVQKGLDHLVEELGKGNTNPGLGTKGLGNGISYARARDGARVFFKQAQDTITIIAKASKANESQVINYLKSLF